MLLLLQLSYNRRVLLLLLLLRGLSHVSFSSNALIPDLAAIIHIIIIIILPLDLGKAQPAAQLCSVCDGSPNDNDYSCGDSLSLDFRTTLFVSLSLPERI